MKETWNVLKLGVYVIALPLVATAAASAHQWMTSNAAIAVVPPPAVVNNTSATRINALRNHTVTINEDGEVQGRVASISHKTKNARGISEAAVYFIQEGEVVKKSYTNDDGTFVIKGLEEGIYSFVSAGEFSFATCGVNLVKSDGSVENYLEVAAITPNVKAVQEIIENELPEEVKQDLRSLASIDVRPANVVGTNRVELDGDVLRGQVVSLLTNNVEKTKAHLFKGINKVKEFNISDDGSFEVDGITAGVYDIVAVGPHGLAAVSFEAVSEDDESLEAYTALQGPELFSSFIVALAPQIDGGCIGGCCGGCGGGSDAIVYGDSPVGFLGNRLGGGIAGGGCCGGAGNFAGFGGGAAAGGRFGGLFGGGGVGRLLLPAIAAGIAIPLGTSSASESAPN